MTIKELLDTELMQFLFVTPCASLDLTSSTLPPQFFSVKFRLQWPCYLKKFMQQILLFLSQNQNYTNAKKQKHPTSEFVLFAFALFSKTWERLLSPLLPQSIAMPPKESQKQLFRPLIVLQSHCQSRLSSRDRLGLSRVAVGDAVDAEVALEEPDRRDVTATAVRAVA